MRRRGDEEGYIIFPDTDYCRTKRMVEVKIGEKGGRGEVGERERGGGRKGRGEEGKGRGEVR